MHACACMCDGRIRAPAGELKLPIGEGGEGDDDQEWSALLLALDEVGDEGDGLDGLAWVGVRVRARVGVGVRVRAGVRVGVGARARVSVGAGLRARVGVGDSFRTRVGVGVRARASR